MQTIISEVIKECAVVGGVYGVGRLFGVRSPGQYAKMAAVVSVINVLGVMISKSAGGYEEFEKRGDSFIETLQDAPSDLLKEAWKEKVLLIHALALTVLAVTLIATVPASLYVYGIGATVSVLALRSLMHKCISWVV